MDVPWSNTNPPFVSNETTKIITESGFGELCFIEECLKCEETYTEKPEQKMGWMNGIVRTKIEE
jgi:hypothetical protein